MNRLSGPVAVAGNESNMEHGPSATLVAEDAHVAVAEVSIEGAVVGGARLCDAVPLTGTDAARCDGGRLRFCGAVHGIPVTLQR
jgi:hypothetical protein